MTRASEFIEKINDYRNRSSAARKAEEEALLRAMEDMHNIMGELQAFKVASTDRFPVNIHDVSYALDVNEFDDQEFGVRILVQRDENRISKISVLTRTSKFEEEKIVTIAPRRVDGVKCWKDETYRRSGEGVEMRAQDCVYSSAEHAAHMLRRSVASAVVHELSYGHAFISKQIPVEDREAAAVVSQLVSYASDVGRDIERNRRIQKDERMKTSFALKGIWSAAEQELRFLADLGFTFDDPEREYSITTTSDSSSLMINIAHSFGYQSSIKLEAMDNNPDSVLVSLSDNEGRDEVISNYHVGDADQLKEEIVSNILKDIEASEKIWVPEEDLDHVSSPTMG
ncbi:hypothetical protein [Mesorhizobium sp. SP-1A]|uniref:hypothetical protein n=1 Tax=Mesorhizobium sp. SP-1A TaxID=3077840 RepID=UPI0028F72C1D|nr:hypothetical protein [Mesorhizobium sp. SP-1A]